MQHWDATDNQPTCWWSITPWGNKVPVTIIRLVYVTLWQLVINQQCSSWTTIKSSSHFNVITCVDSVSQLHCPFADSMSIAINSNLTIHTHTHSHTRARTHVRAHTILVNKWDFFLALNKRRYLSSTYVGAM